MNDRLRQLRHKLQEQFATMDLLYAVDALDQIRYLLADGENLEPPALRTHLLELHGLAHRFINEGGPYREEMWDMAFDLEGEIDTLIEHAEKVREALYALTALAPDPDEDEDD